MLAEGPLSVLIVAWLRPEEPVARQIMSRRELWWRLEAP
jgi:hypothetical protein